MEFKVETLLLDKINLCVTDFFGKYEGKIPKVVTLSDVREVLGRKALASKFERDDWRGDGRDVDGLYLISSGGRYEVFVAERGGKNWLESFDDLISAAVAYWDLLFQQLLHSPPDSMIK